LFIQFGLPQVDKETTDLHFVVATLAILIFHYYYYRTVKDITNPRN